MKDKLKVSLIEGDFQAEEAKEILMNFFSTKVHFHEMKNFSSQERFGKPDEASLKRIPELKQNLEEVLELVAAASRSNNRLIITSLIDIKVVKEKRQRARTILTGAE